MRTIWWVVCFVGSCGPSSVTQESSARPSPETVRPGPGALEPVPRMDVAPLVPWGTGSSIPRTALVGVESAGQRCDETVVVDCNGACSSPSWWVGDGSCDAWLDCGPLRRDGGDCLDEA